MRISTFSPSRWIVATHVGKGTVEFEIRTRHPGFVLFVLIEAFGHLRRLGLVWSPRAWWMVLRALAYAVRGGR